MKTLLTSALCLLALSLLPAEAPKEIILFDGKSLDDWQAVDAGGSGTVDLQDDQMLLGTGESITGVVYKKADKLPVTNYEITLEAMRVDGSDFFCGLTFPVGETACTFVVGGWGGMVVGLSCVDNNDASENETTQGMEFKPDRWYRIRVRVTPEKIEAWIDQEKMVDLEIAGRRIDLRFGDIKHSLPLGIAAFQTRAAIREIRLRRL